MPLYNPTMYVGALKFVLFQQQPANSTLVCVDMCVFKML